MDTEGAVVHLQVGAKDGHKPIGVEAALLFVRRRRSASEASHQSMRFRAVVTGTVQALRASDYRAFGETSRNLATVIRSNAKETVSRGGSQASAFREGHQPWQKTVSCPCICVYRSDFFKKDSAFWTPALEIVCPTPDSTHSSTSKPAAPSCAAANVEAAAGIVVSD